MTAYVVTIANYNLVSFWNSISESGTGHILDFSSLPAGFNVTVGAASGTILIDDGTTTFTIGEAGASGVDATLDAVTKLDFFTTRLGTSENDTIAGTFGTDSIHGGAGDDKITSRGSSNTVDGGDGNDTVYLNFGANHTVFGGDGDDRLAFGFNGGGSLFGGSGHDTLLGYSKNDFIDGGTGDDFIRNGGGQDDGSGNDTLIGGEGADTFSIAAFSGTPGRALGNATIDGGEADAEIDTITFNAHNAGVTVTYTADEAGTYSEDVSDGSFVGIEAITGTRFDDVIDGSLDNAGLIINSGNGADTIIGGGGSDVLNGDAGNDVLTGGAGTNTITGGDGDDLFVYTVGETLTITDFDAGTSTNVDNIDNTDNDFIDLSNFYTNQREFEADLADGTLDQIGVGVDTTDNSLLGGAITGLSGLDGLSASSLLEQTGITCFTPGTLIKTKTGELSVEKLSQGDMVLTMDHGYQPIRWIGSQEVSAATLREQNNLIPIRIVAGALGRNMPERDLLVSPQHRVLIRSKIVGRMFPEQDDVLVAAKHLIIVDGIDVAFDMKSVRYFHFMFDRHEIVSSNGAFTESLYTGPEALKSVSANSRAEIMALFPELADVGYKPTACRELANGRMGRKLALCHRNNSKTLVATCLLRFQNHKAKHLQV